MAHLVYTTNPPSKIDKQHVQAFLNTIIQNHVPCFKDILSVVARYYAMSQKKLKSGSRHKSVVMARAMAVYLARQLSGMSYEQIGQALGGRDHTTIIHNFNKIQRLSAHDLATQQAVADLERILLV
jgi:chromosomal replication initiator protein